MNQKKSEDAVSPVIGVMLLLVVTIVIAAAVAVFASGVGADAEPMPATAVDVDEIYIMEETVGEPAWSWTEEGYEKWYDDETIYGVPGDINGNILDSEDDPDFHAYFMQYEGRVFAIEDQNGYTPFGSNQDLIDRFLEMSGGERAIKHYMTLSCLHGETLDVSKISIQIAWIEKAGDVIMGEYNIEIPLSSSHSGTFSAGDVKRIALTDQNFTDWLGVGDVADVIVYYGDHVLVNKEITVVTRG